MFTSANPPKESKSIRGRLFVNGMEITVSPCLDTTKQDPVLTSCTGCVFAVSRSPHMDCLMADAPPSVCQEFDEAATDVLGSSLCAMQGRVFVLASPSPPAGFKSPTEIHDVTKGLCR